MESTLPTHDDGIVLVIDDEPAILRLLELELSTNGYRVITALDAEDGLAKFARHQPHVVIVDLLLPGTPGVEAIRRIKSASAAPVIVISATSNEAMKLEALDVGADDFIAKPFSPARVTATVSSLLAKEGTATNDPVVTAGGVRIDLQRQLVVRGGRPVRLSESEWRLIEQLARTPGEPRLNQELLANVWGAEYRNDIEYLRAWMKRLRAKLGDTPGQNVIVPYLDVGFTLNVGAENVGGK
jgi:two-component system KDP operon response regulator KdpE